MAYEKESAIAAQNAGSTAATLYASLVNSGQVQGFDPAVYNDIRTAVFNGTLALAGAGAVVEVTEGQPSGNGNVGTPGNANPATVVVNFGRHRGKTISAIAAEDISWVEWAAKECNNPFIKNIAREYLEQQ